MADLLSTAKLYMEAPDVAHEAAKQAVAPIVHTVTTNIIPWSYYMYSVIAAVVTGLVTGVAGYAWGKGWFSTAATAVTTTANTVKTDVSNVTAEVKAVEAKL
jgi:hypothetical protein